MRDEEQERKAVRYIENNPTKARLVLDPATWPFTSARRRNPKTGKLDIPLENAPQSGPPGAPRSRATRTKQI
jgi:hypothetical protein